MQLILMINRSKSDLTGEPSDASSNSSNINSTPLSPPTKAKEVTLSHGDFNIS